MQYLEETFNGFDLFSFAIRIVVPAIALVFLAIAMYAWNPPIYRSHNHQPKESTATDYELLVGSIGITATDLLPTGKAEFDGELVDVIADGDVIDRGAEVEVVSAQANRVLVRLVRR